jgi:hypothetical protein
MGKVRNSGETRRIVNHLVESKMFQLEDVLRTKLASLLEDKADGCIQWVTVVMEHLSQIGVNTLDNIEQELRELSNAPNVLDSMT